MNIIIRYLQLLFSYFSYQLTNYKEYTELYLKQYIEFNKLLLYADYSNGEKKIHCRFIQIAVYPILSLWMDRYNFTVFLIYLKFKA